MTNPFTNNAAPAANNAAPAANSAGPASGFATPETAGTSTVDPFARPTGGGGDKLTDALDQGVLVKPNEFIANMNTANGTTDAVSADWVILTGPQAGTTGSGLVFNVALRNELKKCLSTPGQSFMVGVIGKGEAKPGKNPPFIFQNPSDEVMDLARQAASAQNWI